MKESEVRSNFVMPGYELAKLRKIVDILEESFEAGHNNESYADCVAFAKFLISRGITVKECML